METLVTVIHIVVCVVMILVILLQPGKEGMGSIGGGGGSGAFGPRQPVTILTKVTVGAAAIFMMTSMTLAWLSTRDHSVIPEVAEGTGAVEDNTGAEEQTAAPAADTNMNEAAAPVEAATDPAAEPAPEAPKSEANTAEEGAPEVVPAGEE